MTRLRLFLIFALSCLAFMVAQIPLGWTLSNHLPAGAKASGTLWFGAIDGLPIPASPDARLLVTGRPSALFGLALAADWQLSGLTVNGSGRAEASAFGPRGLRDSQIRFDLSGLPLSIPAIGHLTARIDRLDMADGQRCLAVEGEASSDVLRRTGAGLGWEGPVIAGPLSCENGILVATLTGAIGETEARLRISGDRQRPLTVRIENAPLDLAFALEQAGFGVDGTLHSWPKGD